MDKIVAEKLIEYAKEQEIGKRPTSDQGLEVIGK